jgi:Bacterial Ig domain
VLLDRVNYRDTAPWPPGADGTGASLQRGSLSAYGNEPTNWFASGVTPGSDNRTNAPPSVIITAPPQGAMLGFGQPVTLSADAVDTDGAIRVVEFFVDGGMVGEDSTRPFSMVWSNAAPGTHTITARARDNRLGITTSTPVIVAIVNQPPTVSILTPTNGAAFTPPTNIILEATATDNDGVIVKVEFFANGAKLGEDTSSPYGFVWTNVPSGAFTLTARVTDDGGATTTSAGVSIIAAREITIAYLVDTNTVGSQSLPNPYALGMDFEVLSPIIVTRLGAFDSGSDGLNASSTLTTQIYNRNGPAPQVAASTNFSSADPGVLIGGSRFKTLAGPVLLTNGSYSVVGYGYDGNNRNGNLGTGNAKTWTTDGGASITFVGGGRYGAVAPGGFPATLDGGPADRYAAGTFEFRSVPAFPTIFTQPVNSLVRVGSDAVFTVVAAGRAPLFHQWLFNGVPLTGRTNFSLVLTNVQPSVVGEYSVIVTNSLGAVTSVVASVVLLVDPIIVQSPLSQMVPSGATVTLSVEVTNTATLPLGYRWRRNGAYLADGFFVLTQRTGFFTITNAAPPFNNYAVVVTNVAKPAGNISVSAILTFLTDADGDGTPDIWETAYGFGTNNSADASLDSDGDGASNLAEYLAGTDPTNALSYLRIDSISAVGSATISFGTISNRTYTVQYTDALAAGAWSRLADVPARASNRVAQVIDPNYITRRFYRLTTPQQP